MANVTNPIDERRVAAWIGQALRIEGRIVSQENLTIDGKVDGTIEVGEHTLTIGAGAEVKADLTANAVMISATVKVYVTAWSRVDLKSTDSVEWDTTTT